MDWSQHSIPAMRLEPRFGDRIVPAFCDRPQNIWAMVADAAAKTLTAKRWSAVTVA
jgi:long-chain acyl-CoA synthetase